MDAKKKLMKIRWLEETICLRQEQLEELQKINKTNEKLMQLINWYIDKYTQDKQEIISQIEQIDDTRYVKMLKLRYIDYLRLDEIADEMCYSIDHAKRLHREALAAFENTECNDDEEGEDELKREYEILIGRTENGRYFKADSFRSQESAEKAAEKFKSIGYIARIYDTAGGLVTVKRPDKEKRTRKAAVNEEQDATF